jgi:hypothetical protein
MYVAWETTKHFDFDRLRMRTKVLKLKKRSPSKCFFPLVLSRKRFFNTFFMSNNWYTLLRKWFDFSFENPDKVNIAHSWFYSYLIDRWNRFWQKDIFWIPTAVTMEATNIKSKNTYFSLLNDLERFWFIKIIQKSINQNTATVISLTSAVSKFKSALDTATIQQEYSGGDSTVPIDKQVNKETKKQTNTIPDESEEKIGLLISCWNETIPKWIHCRGITESIKTIWKRIRKNYNTHEEYSDAMSLAIDNYVKDIHRRNKDSDYYNHRFSLYEFLKQENWFQKFLNK